MSRRKGFGFQSPFIKRLQRKPDHFTSSSLKGKIDTCIEIPAAKGRRGASHDKKEREEREEEKRGTRKAEE